MRKYKIAYQIRSFYRQRTGSYAEYNERLETDVEDIYATKEALLQDYPGILNESELVSKYNANNIYDLPDGDYSYYTEIKLYY